jgi:hypothetical protein
VPEENFTLISGKPKAYHYTAQVRQRAGSKLLSNCSAQTHVIEDLYATLPRECGKALSVE